MRVILTAFGSTGDNAPMIALAEALRAQGDEPLLLLNPLYGATVVARDLPYVPVGTRWDIEEVANVRKYLDPVRGANAIWNDLYLPRVAPTFHAVRQAIAEHRADMVVSHWLTFGGHFAARQAGVRSAVVNLAPCWWYSRMDPSIYGPLAGPSWFLRLMVFVPRLFVRHFVGGSLRPVCSDLGLRWRRDEYFAVLREAHLNLGMWSPAFRPAAGDDPDNATICGFPWDDTDRISLDPTVARFLDAGSPPVVVGLGSSMKRVGDSLYREIARACRDLGCRALLVGARPEAAQGLQGIMTVPGVPYRHVFPVARAIIHHGGIGTLGQAIRAGRPMAIVPFAIDQHDNARRAHRLGGALRWSRSRLRGRRLRRAMEQLLEDRTLAQQAAALGAQVQAEPGGATVAARTIAGA
jgi:rhamnosyltransferase subunit B